MPYTLPSVIKTDISWLYLILKLPLYLFSIRNDSAYILHKGIQTRTKSVTFFFLQKIGENVQQTSSWDSSCSSFIIGNTGVFFYIDAVDNHVKSQEIIQI